MKKLICALFVVILASSFAICAAAAGPEPEITLQPQNYNIPVGSTVVYRVEAKGENLTATWYIEFMGQTCEITQGMASEQWRAYVGEDSGPTRDGNNFYCNLTKVQPELAGARVWCVIEDGHYDVASAKAYVMVDENAGYFPNVIVPAGASVGQNGYLELKCDATSADGSYLSYVWYETPSGELMDMTAVNRGEETDPVLICDTSELGTRYYICMVETAAYGRTYSSAIPVTVTEASPVDTEPVEVPATEEPVTDEPDVTDEPIADTSDTDVPMLTANAADDTTTTGADTTTSLPIWAVIAFAAAAAVIAVLTTLLIVKSKKKQ